MQPPRSPRTLAVSRAVAPLLNEPARSGSVHSVFRHAANLWLPPRTLLAIADPTAARAPNGIVVEAPEACRGEPFLSLAEGMAVWVGNGHIHVPARGLRLAAADVPIWDPRPQLPARPIAPAVLGQRLDRLAQHIGDSARAKPLSFASLLHPFDRREEGSDEAWLRDLLARKVQRAAAALLAGIEMGDSDRISSAAQHLAGLGHGLTPSGDDVLIGVCGALALAGAALPASAGGIRGADSHQDQVAAIAAAATGRTTLLSETWLEHAARGDFSAEFGHVLVALANPGPSEFDAAIARLLAIGELSGLDTAMGLLLGGRAVLVRCHHGQDSQAIGRDPWSAHEAQHLPCTAHSQESRSDG